MPSRAHDADGRLARMLPHRPGVGITNTANARSGSSQEGVEGVAQGQLTR